MPKEWTGDLVGMMHTHRITKAALAQHMGYTNAYVSMVLNGKREPAGAPERFRKAVLELVEAAEREQNPRQSAQKPQKNS